MRDMVLLVVVVEEFTELLWSLDASKGRKRTM